MALNFAADEDLKPKPPPLVVPPKGGVVGDPLDRLIDDIAKLNKPAAEKVDLLFVAALGRFATATEQKRIKDRYGDKITADVLRVILDEIAKMPEFEAHIKALLNRSPLRAWMVDPLQPHLGPPALAHPFWSSQVHWPDPSNAPGETGARENRYHGSMKTAGINPAARHCATPVGSRMAAERESPGFADYVVTALSPVLVMLMVGSLVFFLVEVLYAGKYSGRLLYTVAFFVMAAVLVARIAIQYDATRATIYGVILGVVTYLAMLAYVEYPKGWLKSWGWLVNLGLLGLIWWSAHKLTKDCTHIDERQTSSGRGVLSAAGLDADEQANPDRKVGGAVEPPKANPERKRRGKKSKKQKADSRLWTWIDKYKSHREAQRKQGHTPGVWIVYFALAALPLFALGQSLIDPADAERRHTTFLEMVVYIGSALGLLVTTSLLGVRRYLRQRKAKIPASMTVRWLVLGGLLIAVFLALGAFLPRPHSEVPWFGFARAGKSDREASKYAQMRNSSGKGDGTGGNQSKAGDGSASGKGGQPGGGTKGDKGTGGKGNDGKGGSGKKGDQSGGNTKGGGKGDGSENEAKRDEEGGRGGGDGEEAENADEDGGSRSGGSNSDPSFGGLEQVAGVVKWIVFAIIAILILVVIFVGVLRYLAPFTDWARRWLEGLRAWWANLFRKKAKVAAGVRAEEAGPIKPLRPPPFTSYSNPFADGTADKRDPSELVAYTFEALDAWAWDRSAGRAPEETPLEFACRLSVVFPALEDAFMKLAMLYTRSAYSTLPLPDDTLPTLEDVWEQLVHGAPVGA